MKKLLLLVTSFVFVIGLAACKDPVVEQITHTITFETDGGTTIASQEVTEGGLVTKPEDPEKTGYVFDGTWMNDTVEWNFDVDIVTEDITLTAGWILVSSTPTNIVMTDDLFSSNITWTQTDAALQTFTVYVKEETGDFTELTGSVSVESGAILDTVVFTPTEALGGYYYVKVSTGLDEATSEELLLFGGAGTESNPYLTSEVSDIISILEDSTLLDKYFLQVNDILSTLEDPLEINNARQVTFAGIYDGGGYALSFGGNGGLFHEIAEGGVVQNLVIDETTQISASETNLYSIGVIANTNNGIIENISTRGKVVNERLQGELPVFDGTVDTTDLTTGAGAIVGVNGDTGVIQDVNVSGSGLVKAGRGIGGVSAYNFGTIRRAKVTATLAAGNQANSGKSSNTYSFAGGISGFNFGTIEESVVNGRVFAQSAYSTTGDGNEGKNVAIGGITGYNAGTISETSFARNLDMKEFIDKTRAEELEDSANNLGVASVHGDLYVGGITGINAGTITNVYVGGALIGGRDFIGGIAGLTQGTGSIANAYVFAEIAVKDEGGVKITTANDKTTLTTYDIAPSGFDVATTLFKRLLNSATDNTWVPGDLEQPKLPDFTASDLDKVGTHFATSGLLIWQSGQVTGVDISLNSIVVTHGSTTSVDFAVTPSNAPDTYTTWTTSDDSIVEIVGEGLIKGVGAGTATVTVTTRDGGYTDTINVTVEDYIKIDSVTVTADVLTMPEANNADIRPDVEIGTVMTISVDILPTTAEYQNYTITSSNSRAEVDGHTVTFVYGATGPGRVSIYVTFEDSSIGELNFRFNTVEAATDTPIESVTVTADEFTLPTPNDDTDRMEILIGSTATINVTDIVPTNATNQNYTITTSNSRAEVTDNVVTFVYGNTGPGSVSILVTFEDPAIGELNYRFTTVEAAPDTPIESVTVTADEFTLPVANDDTDRMEILIGSTATINVTDILPVNATNQNYTITTSNSRAEVTDNVVTFVYGNTGPGNVSIYVTFEDPAIGELNYRFTTVEPVAITSVMVTADEFTLPTANDDTDRQEILIGATATIQVTDILPANATNQTYTITTSNSRATVDGNVVTFVWGNTGPGSVSIYVTFEDSAIGELNYRFTTIPVSITSVTVTAEEFTLPAANDDTDRQDVYIGQTATIQVTDILPVDASNQNYTITTSNSRATVDGDVVTFVYGDTGPGSVSIYVTFDDPAIGELNYRFTTVEPINIASYSVTATEITLPTPNDDTDRQEITIGSTVTIHVTDILPVDATFQTYTVTTSNSRATVDGNVVTIVYGNTGPGSVSIYVTFDDPTIGELNYRFTTVEAPADIPITSVTVTATEITLPTPNDDTDRQEITIGSTVTINVTDILPVDATVQTYTISTSNSRATVDGNVVTIVYGNTGPGSVSIYVTFDDPAIGVLNYRFTTVEVPA